jgi:NAD(P)-dependent dehydrogenase (short-subunit alcohol dehydrogenase family)
MPPADSRWTADQIPGQRDKTIMVTGANAGIGFETASALAARGATVVLACRDTGRGATAAARITAAVPDAAVAVVPLDLASLDSVGQAAAEVLARFGRLDVLINNAGLMMPPRGLTADGFELQIGTNHLGHFALTGLLLGRLLATPGSRVVTVSSSAHRQGRIDLADLSFGRRKYQPNAAYSQSKLANLLFTYQLQRRLAAAGASTIAVGLEPGFVRTDLPRSIAGPVRPAVIAVTRLIGQPDAAAGALATLRAATDPQVRGGDYYGPDGRLMRASGHPVRIESSARSHDAGLQQQLWAESERLTGVTFDFTASPQPPADGQVGPASQARTRSA